MLRRLAICLVLAWIGPRAALAEEVVERLAVPSFRRVDSVDPTRSRLGFKVKHDQVASISVLATLIAKDGWREHHVFELRPEDASWGRPDRHGYRVWDTDKVGSTIARWTEAKVHELDRIDFSYVVAHRPGGVRAQPTPRHSTFRYTFATGDEVRARKKLETEFDRQPRARLERPERPLDRLDPRAVQAAVDRLARRPPNADYTALPGTYRLEDGRVHPLHAENRLLKQIQRVTAAKRRHPDRDYFVKFSVYIHDSRRLTDALVAAHRAGVRVEGMSEWSKIRPDGPGRSDHDTLRRAGIRLYGIVRSPAPRRQRFNHTKIWIMGWEDKKGQIRQATTFDCSFNTEFSRWPTNQEAMVTYRNNRDVATVYNHFFEAMKGNAPLRLVVDAGRANFIMTHPLYPYVTPAGERFSSQQAIELALGRTRRRATALSFIFASDGVNRELARASGRGACVSLMCNWWKFANHGGTEHGARLRGARVNVLPIRFPTSAADKKTTHSPVHHKEVEVDGRWTTTGSWNPWHGSNSSDETLVLMRSPRIARKIRAQANRLLHHPAYEAVPWNGSKPLPRLTRAVRFEVRLPRSINPADVEEVLFAAGGSKEIDNRWVKLDQNGKRKNRVVYSGTRDLPVGFVHHGRPLIRLKSGRKIWAPHGDTYFEVSPARRRGRIQRIRLGFGKLR
jgi:hypothetical protein